MGKKTRTYPGIGEVAFVRSRRARRLTLSVKPWRGVRVTLPWYAAYREAEAFLLQHTAWLKEKIEMSGRYEAQAAGREDLTETLRKRAREYLPGRTAELALQHGFSYRRVTIRASRTRWGSCSAANNINLSLYLMQLPPKLIDYVILHELVHTRHKNHGPAFRGLLDSITGDSRALDKEIRKYRITT